MRLSDLVVRSLRVAAGVIAFALISFPAAASAGEIYRWTDEKGELHFTQDPEQIPPRYRYQSQAPTGNLNVVEGTEPKRPRPETSPRLMRLRNANRERPGQEPVPEILEARPRPKEEAARPLKTHEKYEYDCMGEGTRCRRVQTKEFREWKANEAARKAEEESEDEDF